MTSYQRIEGLRHLRGLWSDRDLSSSLLELILNPYRDNATPLTQRLLRQEHAAERTEYSVLKLHKTGAFVFSISNESALVHGLKARCLYSKFRDSSNHLKTWQLSPKLLFQF